MKHRASSKESLVGPPFCIVYCSYCLQQVALELDKMAF